RERARKLAIFDFIIIDKKYNSKSIYKITNMILYHVNSRHRDGHIRTNTVSIVDDELTARRAKTHIEMYKKNSQWGHLVEFISIAERYDHEVTIILSPARTDYKKYCNEIIFDKNYVLKNIPYELRTKVNILDFFNNNLIPDYEFADCDHLKNVRRTLDLFDGALRIK
ncbi:MAG: hypothetical protein ACKOEC_04760, partial [Acidimicrobiia bacterium]